MTTNPSKDFEYESKYRFECYDKIRIRTYVKSDPDPQLSQISPIRRQTGIVTFDIFFFASAADPEFDIL